MTTETNQETLLIKIDRVKEMTGLSTTTIYEHIKKGLFPQPKKCGRATRWRLADVQAYINS
ncbi:MAG: AlpA family phage regulatory protein [[Actinobacillus] rossii]|nr:AlpA family phage regulatory protein [[Actinobacillus] rossii]MDY4505706.1 AlpA family phage regulatory protein [[Actinobacillus] rossii]